MSKIKRSHRAQGSSIDRLVRKNQPRRDFIQTPGWLADMMVRMSGLLPGESALDPCVGDGAVMRAIARATNRSAGIEMHPDLFELTALSTPWRLWMGDFLEMSPDDIGFGQFNVVVMNPPFSQLGAWRFVQHAVDNWIKPGGRVVSVIPQYIIDNAEGRKHWLDHHIWKLRVLPKHAFAPGAPTLHASVAEFRREPRPADSAFGFIFEDHGS